jgi:iron complex transport system permease protein
MNGRARATGWVAGLSALLFGVVVVATTIGPVSLSAVAVAKALLNELVIPTGVALGAGSGFAPAVETTAVFDFAVSETTALIVTEIRLPRILLAAVVGLSLGAAGTVMQGLFRNPMADPSIIGVSSGAAVGAVATIAVPSLIPLGLRPAAFVGAVVTAFAVYAIARENGRTPVATLLLAGVAIQTLLGAVVSYLLLHSGESLERAVYWLMGDLAASTYDQVTFTLLWALVGVPVLVAYGGDLNVLLLGEEEAHHLGVAVERTRAILLAVASVVTAAAVAVAGVIGFVGLIVPHAMRLLVGPDHRLLLPTSALAGASFLVAADAVARSGPAEMPVGIVTAALGAPFFLYLLRQREVTEL